MPVYVVIKTLELSGLIPTEYTFFDDAIDVGHPLNRLQMATKGFALYHGG